MSEYILSCCSTADLSKEYFESRNIHYICFHYMLGDKSYPDDLGQSVPFDEFYARMAAGEMTKTSQVNVDEFAAYFEGFLKEGKDILHGSLSSGLSGSVNSARIAAEELAEKYPENKVLVVDSLSASMGHGLLVEYALRLKAAGKTIEETAALVTQNRLKFCHYFTVDDLNHLHRGGRVSKVSAVVGGMLGIKPILNVNEEGKLIPFAKVRGRKQSLLALVENMKKKYHNDLDLPVFISHGDAPEDANFVADQIREHFGIQDIRIGTIGPVIGAHAGPGTVALFFIGKDRSI